MASVKFGMYTPFYPWDFVEKVVRTTAKYDSFDSVWFGDHLVGFPKPEAYDAWGQLLYFAIQQKRLKVGMSVGDPHRHHPSVMAQTIMTIDVVSKGRVLPGFGPGEAMNLDPYGIDWKRPVSKLREFVNVMKMLWTGKSVTFHGEFYHLDEAILLPRCVQEPSPPVWIAANGKRSLEVAGEVGDGWMPLAESEESYRKNLDAIRQSSRKAGRPADAVKPGLFLYAAVAEESEKARAMAEPITKIPLVWFSKKLRDQFGYDISFGDLEFNKALVSEERIRKTMEASKKIPTEFVKQISAFGTPDECIAKIEKFVKAGARYIVLVPLVDSDKAWTDNVDLFGKKVLPYFDST